MKAKAGDDSQKDRTVRVAKKKAGPKVTWLPLIPAGVVLIPGGARPVLLLKNEESGETLPVWMGALDASVALQELAQGGQGSPHTVAKRLLQKFGLVRGKCYFIERIGHHQYVHLHLETEAGIELPGEPMRLRADEAMSFSLAMKLQFFGTREFIDQCRVINQEMESLQEKILVGETMGGQNEDPGDFDLNLDLKKSGYVM